MGEMRDIRLDDFTPIGQFSFSRIILMNEDGVNADDLMGIRFNSTWYSISRENIRVLANAILEELDD
jgi:hypothetical protein